jgi:hypothetical protein
MKLTEKMLHVLESSSKPMTKRIEIEVTREMIKGFKAEVALTVFVDEKLKADWLEKRTKYIEEEAEEQGNRNNDAPDKIKAEQEKRVKKFLSETEKDIEKSMKKTLSEGIRIRSTGEISLPEHSRDWPFIYSKVTSDSNKIDDAGEIDDWKYDGGEVAIENETYKIRN